MFARLHCRGRLGSRRRLPVLIACAAVALLAAQVAKATPILVPSGLQDGDTYRLFFVTSGTYTATNTSISNYDTTVQGLANNAGIGATKGITWKVLGSTADTSAISRFAGTEPVYNLHDQMVAHAGTLWTGSIAYPVGYDQYGNSQAGSSTVNVWTGTGANGSTLHPLGSTDFVEIGNLTSNGYQWMAGAQMAPGNHYHLYAMSNVLTKGLQAEFPEPASVCLLATAAVAGAAGLYMRRRRRGKPLAV